MQLDVGHQAAKAIIVQHMILLLEGKEVDLGKDAKTALQKDLQAKGLPVPTYSVLSQGKPGARLIEVQCSVLQLNIALKGPTPATSKA